MRRTVLFVSLFGLAVVGGSLLRAQSPAPSATEALVRQWNDAGHKVIEMAEDFPEEKYDFKPSPEVRSFAEQLLHVAGSNYFFMNLDNLQPPAEDDLPREKYKTKAEIVAALKKSVADGAAFIRKQGDAGLTQEVKFPWSPNPTNGYGLWVEAVEHVGEHYGQLVVYYRVNGMVPPASRPRR